jgi:cellobiose phosphorylase
MGDGERAWRYLWNVLPSRYNEIADVRGVEPYVVCQSTHSSFSPRYGAGRVSWLSGSAVWNYVAMSSAILGIQPDYGGLRIAPCIPPGWDRYRVTRRFRGANYSITIENPGHRSGGVESMTVNGTEIEGNLIPVADAGSEVEVHIVLSGKAKIQ